MSLREQVSPTQNAALLPAGVFPIHFVKNAALTLSPCQCPGEDNASLTLAGRSRGHQANAALDKSSLCRRISSDLPLPFDLCVGMKLLGSVVFLFVTLMQ